MAQPLRFEGRRVTLRLSDVDEKIRLAAAERVSREIMRLGVDPTEALNEAASVQLIAADPVYAAQLMPHECRNEPFSVSEDEYLRVVAGVSIGVGP